MGLKGARGTLLALSLATLAGCATIHAGDGYSEGIMERLNAAHAAQPLSCEQVKKVYDYPVAELGTRFEKTPHEVASVSANVKCWATTYMPQCFTHL